MSKPINVAIACQGGGAQTAFTAGALAYLMDAQSKQADQKHHFEIVALSGTSGGAVCASLAWSDLLLDRSHVGRDNLAVSRFWKTGYPEGNAALPYPDAWLKDWQEFWLEGRLPWLHTADRIRAEAAVALYQAPEYTDFMPVMIGVESNPYFFNNAFRAMDSMIPAPLKALLDITQEALRSPAFAGVYWIRNFIGDMLDLLPLHEESMLRPGERATIRREFDVQDAFRALLKKYFTPADLDQIQERFRQEKGRLPELLIGAVDVQHTHDESWNEGKQKKKGEPSKTEKQLTDIENAIDIEQSDLEQHVIHRADRTNYKVFRGSRNLERLVDCIISSAAIPTVMRGVELDGSTHWDGLFSANPPLYHLPDVHHAVDPSYSPEELWVIRINPMEISDRPDTPHEIVDRRNELAGNLSLLQEIHAIRAMNGTTKGGRFYRPIAFGFIDMAEELAQELDYPTKLDRRLEYVTKLFDDGWRQAESFLGRWQREARHWEDDKEAKHAIKELSPSAAAE
jgi:predicted acylesterase/phospholipase RssA